MLNTVSLVGRLTKDVEIRKTQSGKSVTSFTLAVDKRRKEDGANFIDCVAWEKTADLMKLYLSKGSQIGVTGSIETRTYEREDRKVKVTEVLVDSVTFLDGKGSEKPQQPTEEAIWEPPLNITSDELPF